MRRKAKTDAVPGREPFCSKRLCGAHSYTVLGASLLFLPLAGKRCRYYIRSQRKASVVCEINSESAPLSRELTGAGTYKRLCFAAEKKAGTCTHKDEKKSFHLFPERGKCLLS